MSPYELMKKDVQRETLDRIASFLGKCIERRPDDPVACILATLCVGSGSAGAERNEAVSHSVATVVHSAHRMTEMDSQAREDIEALVDWTRTILDTSLEAMRRHPTVNKRALEVWERRP